MLHWTGSNEKSIPFGSQIIIIIIILKFLRTDERTNGGGRSLCRAWSRAEKRELNGEHLSPIYSQTYVYYRDGWHKVDLIWPSFP